jgi:phosphoribosylaminoimidazole carboxylase PurE protein
MGERVLVSILMGSDSDWPIMAETGKVLERFKVPHEFFLSSAHRSPERTITYAREAAGRGIKVIIAGAGSAAHLAGVIASHTCLPVIGVPLDSSPLHGFDALLSTVQMPAGVPVATMAVGKGGAKNAALFSVRILALEDERLRRELEDYVREMASEVEAKHISLMGRKGQS